MCCPPYGIVRAGEPGSDDYEDYYYQDGSAPDHCTSPYEFERNVTGPFLEKYDQLVEQEDPNFCLVKKAGNVCAPRGECIGSDQCK